MAPDTRLLFYGDSVFLAGLKAEMATAVAPLPHLLTLPTNNTNALQSIRDYHPQAVLFDLSVPDQPDAIPLLRQQPNLLLIGLDPSRNELLVLSSQSPQAVHVNDLVSLIHRQETMP